MNYGEPAQLRAFSGPPDKKKFRKKNCLDTTRRSKIRIIPVQSEGKFPYTQRGVPITSYWE
jgi:hypothetical protein